MCGVCGIWSPEGADPTEAARLMFFSLYALQHRGQESAGIAATDGRDLRVVRRMGLVAGGSRSGPRRAQGRAAMGHPLPTTGSSRVERAAAHSIGTTHLAIDDRSQQQLHQRARARDDLAAQGALATSSDTEVVARASCRNASWDERSSALPTLHAWSLVLLAACAHAVRDPFGVRPLTRAKDGSWLVASESRARHGPRDVRPRRRARRGRPHRRCRPDDGSLIPAGGANSAFEASTSPRRDNLGGVSVYSTRERMARSSPTSTRRRGRRHPGPRQRGPRGGRLHARRHPVPRGLIRTPSADLHPADEEPARTRCSSSTTR